jgi:hypothetical protein
VAQLLGYQADVSKILSGAVKLCASKRGETWPRAGGKSISMVFGEMVRANRVALNSALDLSL